MEERLQKIMAKAGLGSRRDCELLISAGRVLVNGKVAILGTKANLEVDRIVVDGTPLRKLETLNYVALNKPRGILSTTDTPDTRQTVRDLVPLPGTLYPVGRLDVESEGLILLTNDGDLANKLTHPRYGHEKEYRVLVAKIPDDIQLGAWRHGVVLEDEYRTSPAHVEIESTAGKGAWLKVILREGRKRQIREMGFKTGLPVVRIIRVRIGSLQLGGLKPGEWRNLTPHEVTMLKNPSGSKSQKLPPSRGHQRPPTSIQKK
jgi:23S rRNA pseudouridine2605 synthase